MEDLLYENVNDGGDMDEFLSSGGFCRHHTDLLTRFGDPLGQSIVYSRLLQSKMDLFDWEVHDRNHSPCMFCVHESANEISHIESFSSALVDNAFLDQYEQGGLLCILHYLKVTSILSSTGRRQVASMLQAITKQKHLKLNVDLNEIQRKNDYRYSHELWTESETISWRRASRLLID